MTIIKETETKVVVAVIVIASITIAGYISAAVYFDWNISKNPNSWGPFGDYFGGILNPAIAIAALYVLIRATKYQKSEFTATRIHLETEANKNETYRVIEHIDSKLNTMLSVDVKERASSAELGIVTLGPLGHYLQPGWRARKSFYVVLGDSNLETAILRYLPKIKENIELLEEYLNQYNVIANKKSTAVSSYFEKVYLPMKNACEEIVKSHAKK